ncbi:MAG: hypothetical protein B7Y36_18935 [Novosphingobium sp. 28-62-57]|uniref:hypothetical protein n=1 Tax=unclassified Novosphingobium TaxID=2644732 RepID=UPI000BD4AAD8|nr:MULTISPECIES: hypothetical protein [unclassified Novosphingobium]OYW51154.1 MAG: hypothetical protein B7Z34_02470 [Novosphingobium sp. 12-62-10]OYZ07723.1 MAG: hypothetical protein B7Y36_18935 [Novosphingobium sp. 28-62-57]
MGTKAKLARELDAMLTSEASDSMLASWLRQHGKVVHHCLDAMDDMVTIPEIDLQDMMVWAKERGLLTPVPASPRP